MKEIKFEIAGIPVTVIYAEPAGNGLSYKHDSGAVLDFSTEMVKVYKLSWANKTEIIALTTKNDDETLIELAWQCFFKALAVHSPEEESSYDALSKDMYACSFCNAWTQIRDELSTPESICNYEDDFMDPSASDWEWYDGIDDEEWRK